MAGRIAGKGTMYATWGDPHTRSGDMSLAGVSMDNQKIGTFTQLKSDTGDFQLQTHQEKLGWAVANRAAAVKAGTDTVTFDAKTGVLKLNGQAIAAPAIGTAIDNTADGGAKIARLAHNVLQITSPQGDVVNITAMPSPFGYYLDVTGEVSGERESGDVEGALGNFDDDTTYWNDLKLRNGQILDLGASTPQAELEAAINYFLEDWRTEEGESLFAAGASSSLKQAKASPSLPKPKVLGRAS